MMATYRPNDILDSLAVVTPEHLRDLHTRLEIEAEEHDLLDIAYHTIDTPIGPLLLASTTQGLVRVAFGMERHGAVLEHLAIHLSPRILHAPGRLDPVVRQLEEYFAGRRKVFNLSLDFRLSKGFRRTVVDHLSQIPYGHTESYSQVAAAVGNPRAVRAVGTACAMNPLPVVVPCHRVLRADGTLGGYLGGVHMKQALLALEGAV